MALDRRPKALKDLEKLKDAAAKSRLPWDRDAWLNLAFYLDEQYTTWDNKTGSVQRIPRTDATKNAPRPVVNKIMHFVQQERTQVLQAKPTADVLPATDDYADISHAAVAKAYLTWLCEPVNMDFTKQIARATLWAIICGEGYLKWVYNPRTKQPEAIPCSYFDVYADPYVKDFKKARYVIHTQFMDCEQVYEAWGVEVKPNDVEKADALRTELLRGMGSSPVLSGVTVNELWELPSRRHPKGRYAVWTPRQFLVEPTELPYAHGRLPFTQIGCIERPDSQHYMSPVKYLRPAQMMLNQYHAQRIAARRAFASPKWWIPSELEMEVLPDDSPNQILRGNSMNGTVAPALIQPAAMADNGDGAMIEEQMMHIVGLHEVSQAQVPGRVEAAKAIELLKESDADRRATMLDSISASISEGFFQLLMLAKQYVSTEQMVTVYSREGMPEVKRFKAQDIKAGTRVQTLMGTALARSRAARNDLLITMWQNKIITDPAVMAELMEVPFPSFADPEARDQRLARNENATMAAGQPVTPNSWDDHLVHIAEHNDYRKTQEFLALDEKVKAMFEYHVTQHHELQKAEVARQAALMMAAQPQVPGAPAGAGPPQAATEPPQDGTVDP